MNDKALRYLGLAARAGKVVIGVEECGKAAGKNRHAILILASDAAVNAQKSASELAEGFNISLLPVRYSKRQIGDCLGRANGVALVMLTEKNLASAFKAAVQSEREQEE